MPSLPSLPLLSLEILRLPLHEQMGLDQSSGHLNGFGPCEKQPHAQRAKKLPIMKEHIRLWKGCGSG